MTTMNATEMKAYINAAMKAEIPGMIRRIRAADEKAKLAQDAANAGTWESRFPKVQPMRSASATGMPVTVSKLPARRSAFAIARDAELPTASPALVEAWNSAEKDAMELLGGAPPSRNCPDTAPLEQAHVFELYRDTLTELGLPTEGMSDAELKAAFAAEVAKLKSSRAPVAAQDSARVGSFSSRFPKAGLARSV
jgi:hypothetical protein